jgi:heme oxygenase (biliverdin-producing, ferredoxin)
LDTGLAQRLKHDTRALHAQAERSGVMHDLVRGRIGLPAYCALLRNLHAVYSALEAALAQAAADPCVQCLDTPALHRTASLALDLDHLHAGPWRQDFAIEPAAAIYAVRLATLAASHPRLLVAHAYVRYLGDLHGGQLLQKQVMQCFALVGDQGTRFYRFGTQADVEGLRQRLRMGLARAPVTAQDVDAIVAEACWAFDQHKALFVELQSRHGGAAPQPAG